MFGPYWQGTVRQLKISYFKSAFEFSYGNGFVSYNKIKVIFNIRQNFCKFLFRKHVNLQNIIKMKMKKNRPTVCLY